MKTLITILALSITCAHTRELNPADETQAIYQMDWGYMPPGNMWFGGSWSERTITRDMTPAERSAISNEASAAMYRKAAYGAWILAGLACIASYLMKAREGIGVAIICGLFSFASSFMASTVHYSIRIGACAIIALMIAACYHKKIRDWSLLNRIKQARGK